MSVGKLIETFYRNFSSLEVSIAYKDNKYIASCCDEKVTICSSANEDLSIAVCGAFIELASLQGEPYSEIQKYVKAFERAFKIKE